MGGPSLFGAHHPNLPLFFDVAPNHANLALNRYVRNAKPLKVKAISLYSYAYFARPPTGILSLPVVNCSNRRLSSRLIPWITIDLFHSVSKHF